MAGWRSFHYYKDYGDENYDSACIGKKEKM